MAWIGFSFLRIDDFNTTDQWPQDLCALRFPSASLQEIDSYLVAPTFLWKYSTHYFLFQLWRPCVEFHWVHHQNWHWLHYINDWSLWLWWQCHHGLEVHCKNDSSGAKDYNMDIKLMELCCCSHCSSSLGNLWSPAVSKLIISGIIMASSPFWSWLEGGWSMCSPETASLFYGDWTTSGAKQGGGLNLSSCLSWESLKLRHLKIVDDTNTNTKTDVRHVEACQKKAQ